MQTMIVVLILLAAAAYVGRIAWRAVRSGAREDGGGCGSGSCH
ncbi:MAG: FeoB-associated Cys-rich membrane protein [Gemmatimonadaceae bacterium]